MTAHKAINDPYTAHQLYVGIAEVNPFTGKHPELVRIELHLTEKTKAVVDLTLDQAAYFAGQLLGCSQQVVTRNQLLDKEN